jgi:hypothetical protein
MRGDPTGNTYVRSRRTLRVAEALAVLAPQGSLRGNLCLPRRADRRIR